MGTSLVRQMIKKGRCALCGRPLDSVSERRQDLCGRCFEIRRVFRKWDMKYVSKRP